MQTPLFAPNATTKLGCKREPISIEHALKIEPALADVAPDLAGVIYAPDDQSGDAHMFTDQLAAMCRQTGVLFQFGSTVNRIDVEGGRVSGVITDQGRVNAEAIVVALGSYAPRVFKAVWHSFAHLSGQGIFRHLTRGRSARGAINRADRRRAQDRLFAAG